MKKLAFLVGTWTGDATTVRPNQKIKVKQTEEVSYKLDGLVLCARIDRHDRHDR